MTFSIQGLDDTPCMCIDMQHIKEFCLLPRAILLDNNELEAARKVCAQAILGRMISSGHHSMCHIISDTFKQQCVAMHDRFYAIAATLSAAWNICGAGTGQWQNISLYRTLRLCGERDFRIEALSIFDIEALFTMPLNEFETALKQYDVWLEASND